jgi:gliding motility-associated-like protein
LNSNILVFPESFPNFKHLNKILDMKRIIALFAVVFFTLGALQTKASHFAAAEIWYEYVSPLTYKVHVGCYLDCKPTNANYFFSQLCWWSTSGCGTSGTATLDTTGVAAIDPYQDDTLSQLCPGVPNWCQQSTSQYPAYKYRHFINIVTLSNACTDWNFGVSDNARNSVIGNGFANQTMSVHAELNNIGRPINSSPQFTVKPIPYVCQNQPQVYQNGPYDPDLDSVFFESITPQAGGCQAPTNLTFSGTNNVNSPFPSTGFIVYPQAGNASFTPTTIGVYVFAFRATDYDKITGIKVGSSQRDVQINVLSCNTPPPITDSVTNIVGALDTIINGQHEMTVCPGTTMSFVAYGHSPIITNNLSTYADLSTNQFPNSTPTYTSTNTLPGEVQGNFSWTPSALDFGNHTVILTFIDSTCLPGLQPIILKSYATVVIKVLPGVSAGGPYNYCQGGLPLQLQATGPQGITTWTWSIIPGQAGNPQANFSATNIANPTSLPSATVDVMVEGLPVVTGCPNKDTVTLNVFTPLVVNAGPDILPCANDQVTINATTNRAPGTTTQTWTPSTYLSNATILTPNAVPLGSMQYILNVSDANGCKGRDTMEIQVQGIRPIISAYPERDTVCIGEQVHLYANASPQPCGITATASNVPAVNKIIGTGNMVNSFFSPFYRDGFSGYRAQYLIRADELIAAGMSPGNIKGMTLNVQSAPSNGPTADSLLGLKIKLGCTPLTSLSTTTGFIPGLSNVFTANKFAPVLGSNVINFPISSEYFWDGKSNLVVEFCYNLPQFSGGNPAPVFSTITSYNSSLVDQDYNTAGCQLSGSTASFYAAESSLRPNFKFFFAKTNTFGYKWAPFGAVNNDTLENPIVNANFIQGQTTFTVTVISGAQGQCNGTDNVTVYVDNSGGVDPTATPAHICEPGLVTLNATPTVGTQAPVYNCGEENFITNGAPTNFNVGAGALSYSIPFTYYDGGKTQYMITAAELTAAGISKGRIDDISLNVLTKNSIQPFQNMVISMGCTKELAINNFVNIGSMKPVYSSAAYFTTIGWNTFTLQTPFLWDGISNLVIEMCFNGHTDQTGDFVQCVATPTAAAFAQGLYAWNGSTDGCSLPFGAQGYNVYINGTNTVRPNTRMTITSVANKAFQYVWTPPLYVYDTTKAQTLAYVLNTKTYTVALVNRTGCLIKDTVNVRLETHDVTASPLDTAICGGDKMQLFAYGTGTGLLPTYQWTPQTNVQAVADTTIIVNPSTTTLYTVVRTDEFGCKDTATSNVKVLPSPNVTITNGDSITVLYGNEVNLLAIGANKYSWTPTWALSNSNSSNAWLSPKEDATYFVYGIDTNGCANHDSIYVKINYTNPVFIPNGFTPNGDGNNDRFKVSHYNFEKVQEFRIFNRFGEEVFSGTNNDGWDGTYKGKMLDMDTYSYIIRLAYPDGQVKVFKGDVVLMR